MTLKRDFLRLPSLDGVSVSVNGRPGYPALLIHGTTDQLNVQAPTDGAITGDATIRRHAQRAALGAIHAASGFEVRARLFWLRRITRSTGSSISSACSAARQPDHRLVYACPPNSFDGLVCRLPKPGEIVTFLWDRFLGQRNGWSRQGRCPRGAFVLVDKLSWKFRGDRRGGSFLEDSRRLNFGLYQFNVLVPNVAPGEYAITVGIGGQAVPQLLYLQVGSPTVEN